VLVISENHSQRLLAFGLLDFHWGTQLGQTRDLVLESCENPKGFERFSLMRLWLSLNPERQSSDIHLSQRHLHTCHFETSASAIVFVADLTPKSS
jgi:hypothetical protein